MPMQLTEIFKLVKMKIFSSFFFLNIFALNIDCGNTLEPLRRGGSNQYPQSIFRAKRGSRGYTCHGHVSLMLCYILAGYNVDLGY